MRNLFLLLILAVTAVAITSCEPTKNQEKPTKITEPDNTETAETTKNEEPPLLLDDEPPLLLDDEPENASAREGADNSRCFVCHINYMKEEIAVVHALANIGCATCHGESDEHIADESWASGGNGTAPDIMYTRDKIRAFCMGCHDRNKINTNDHKPLFDVTKNKTCTDCHGDHRLVKRTTKWK